MELYVIQHRETGNIMPNRARGTTHWEPSENAQGVPKFYATKRGAKQAIAWWEKGKTTTSMTGGHDVLGGYDEWEDWRTEKVEGRKRGDLVAVRAVIRFDLTNQKDQGDE